MRRSLVIPLLVAFPLCAQDAWTHYVGLRQAADEATRKPWALVYYASERRNPSAWMDDALLKLVVGKDLTLDTPDDTVLDALWKQKGWQKGAQWVLLDPDSRVALEGTEIPSGKAIVDTLEKAKYTTSWEKRRRFLSQHPHHGEAWLDQLDRGLVLALSRLEQLPAQGKRLPLPGSLREPNLTVMEGPAAENWVETAFEEAAEALEGLASLSDASESVALGAWTRHLDSQDLIFVRLSRKLCRLLDRLKTDCARAWRCEPVGLEMSVGLLWMKLDLLLNPTGALVLPGDFTPPPDVVWPSCAYVDETCQWAAARGRWDDMLAFVSSLPERTPKRRLSARAWDAIKARRALAAVHRAWVHGHLGQWEDFSGALQDAKRWAGASWATLPAARRLTARLPNLAKDRPEAYQSAASSVCEPDLPGPPARPLLRLQLYGVPEWRDQWVALRQTEALAPWGPGELVYEQKPLPDAALRSHYQWDDSPRWALFFGETLLATGTEALEADALAAQMAMTGQTALQALDEYVAEEPDNRDIRKARYVLLKTRMPHAFLEDKFLEDATYLMPILDFDLSAPWKPNEVKWSYVAPKVMNALEATLLQWPSRTDLWRAWVSWCPFHEGHVSPLALVSEVVIWGDRANWTAKMPKAVHEVMAAEWRRTRQWRDMRAWFQEAYNGLDKRSIRDRKGRVQEWLLARRRQEGEAIVVPLREALNMLRYDMEAVLLEQEWRALTGRGPKNGE